MTDTAAEEGRRERSPSFPFIPLAKAIERAKEFADAYKRYPARVTNAVQRWGYQPKSSGGQQTVAALKAFGLMEESGAGEDRKVQLTDLAWRILKDERPGQRDRAIAEAAIKPKMIDAYWNAWKDHGRPPDAECISELTLERGFTDDAAKRFLSVYDDTIAYAKLGSSDILSVGGSDSDAEPKGDGVPPMPPVFPLPERSKVRLMEGERVVFTEETTPNQYVKLVANGDVNDFLLEALEDYVKRQRKIRALLKQPSGAFKKPEWADKTFSPGDTVPGSTPFRAHHVGHVGEGLIEPDEGEIFPACEECGEKVRYTLA